MVIQFIAHIAHISTYSNIKNRENKFVFFFSERKREMARVRTSQRSRKCWKILRKTRLPESLF